MVTNNFSPFLISIFNRNKTLDILAEKKTKADIRSGLKFLFVLYLAERVLKRGEFDNKLLTISYSVYVSINILPGQLV